MRVGIISGSGTYDWPGLSESVTRQVATSHGEVAVTEGSIAGVDVVHLGRHDQAHARLSNHVRHHANLAALIEAKCDAVISLTVCGAVAPDLAPGSLVVFDDLHFPGNRLPDGTLCTWYGTPGMSRRGHWIFDRPFSESVRYALLEAGKGLDVPMRSSGCYGHVDGPRFNSRTEIAALAYAGVVAVSQTAGPEVVLAGEAELPLALVGFVTDYANGVSAQQEPVEALLARVRASSGIFASLVEGACGVLSAMEAAGNTVAPAGFVYRFEG